MFFRLRSHANRTPSSTTFASVAKACRGRSIILLIAPINCLFSFLITSPTPQQPNSLNTAPSALILLCPFLGGIHTGLIWGVLLYPRWHTEFLLFHKLQAVTANNSQSSSSLLFLISHSMYMKSLGIISKPSSLIFVFPHTKPISLQPHKMCSDVSQLPHKSHFSSYAMPLVLSSPL